MFMEKTLATTNSYNNPRTASAVPAVPAAPTAPTAYTAPRRPAPCRAPACAAPPAHAACAARALMSRTALKRAFSLFMAIVMSACFLNLGAFTDHAQAGASSDAVGIGMLLRGYNLFGNQILDNAYLKTGIFKPSAATALSDLYGFSNMSYTDAYVYSAKSMTELLQKKASNIGINASVEIGGGVPKIYSFKASASVKFSRDGKSAYSTATDKYFFESEFVRKQGKNAFNNWVSPATKQRVIAELDDYFLDRLLNEANVNLLFRDYGTHFLTSYTMGGSAGVTVSTVETRTSEDTYAKYDFEQKTKAEVTAMTISAAAEFTGTYMDETSELEKNTNYESYSKAFTYGGQGSLALSGNAADLQTSVQNWLSTIKHYGNDANCTILIDENLELVPLWDLLPDGYEYRKWELQQKFQEMLLEFDITFNNMFIYQAVMSGGVSAPVTVHPSGSPTLPSGRREISTASQFINIGTAAYPANGNYILTSNIDLAGQTRLETLNTEFTGTFDGNGYAISNYNITQAIAGSKQFVGLFGSNKGTVKNLVIRNSSIRIDNPGPINVVGLVAGANTGTIENVQVENSSIYLGHTSNSAFFNGQSNIGGIAGNNGSTGRIYKSCVSSNAEDMDIKVEMARFAGNSAQQAYQMYTGGIAGNNNGVVRDCYTDVPVKVDVNFVSYSYTTVGSTNLANTLVLVGGIAGDHRGTSGSGATIERCFAVKSASMSHNLGASYNELVSKRIGRLVGEKGSTAIFKDAYCLSGVTSVGNGGSTSGITSVSSYKNAAMTTLLTNNGWIDLPAYSYPKLPLMQHKFDVYYKGSIPTYEQAATIPAPLSSHMTVYFGGVKNITEEVNLRYDFNSPGTRPVQLTYRDSSGTVYTGNMNATVVAAPTPPPPPKDAPQPSPTPGEPTPTPTPTPPPSGQPEVTVFAAQAIETGVKLEWPKASGDQYYRVFRSTSSGVQGISVTDFAITANNFVDVNVKPGTTYYYTYAQVLEDANPWEDIPEKLGPLSGELVVTTFNVILEPDGTGEKHFILMRLESPDMSVDGILKEIDPGRGTSQ